MGVDLLNVRGLKELAPQGPVVMVNLMRFHELSLDGDGSGWDAYLRYSALTVPMIKARGGTLLWTGDAKAVALGRRRATSGTIWRWLLSLGRRLYRHDDISRHETMRSAPPQRLRRARDHRDGGGLQQVQDIGGWRKHHAPHPEEACAEQASRRRMQRSNSPRPSFETHRRWRCSLDKVYFPARAQCSIRSGDLPAHHCGAVAHRLELSEGDLARQVLHAAIGRGDQRSRRRRTSGLADSLRNHLRGLDLRIAEVDHAEHDLLARRSRSTPRSSFGCAASIEIWSACCPPAAAGTNSRTASRARHHRRIAEAEMHHGRDRHALQRAVDRLHAHSAWPPRDRCAPKARRAGSHRRPPACRSRASALTASAKSIASSSSSP